MMNKMKLFHFLGFVFHESNINYDKKRHRLDEKCSNFARLGINTQASRQ